MAHTAQLLSRRRENSVSESDAEHSGAEATSSLMQSSASTSFSRVDTMTDASIGGEGEITSTMSQSDDITDDGDGGGSSPCNSDFSPDEFGPP